MFIPIRTDRPQKHTPWVNYSLIALNVLVHVAFTIRLQPWDLVPYYLDPNQPQTYQYFSYQFLHQGWMHLISNMIFLMAFGSAMEDRFGKIGYLAYYLAGGVLAGLTHCVFSDNYVIGASGSVCAVTGGFLALFPRTHVTIVYFFFFIGAFEVASIILILFQIGQDLFFYFFSASPVAYEAHLGGYLYGFTVGMLLLWTKLLPREPYDMFILISQWRRRQQFKALNKQGQSPWASASWKSAPPGADEAAGELSEQDQQLVELRTAIGKSLANHDPETATHDYLQLLELDGSQVLSEKNQLDVANHLMQKGSYEQAATAYELMLNHYPRYSDRDQVQLILGLIYARYLSRKQRAKELLTAALPELTDPGQKQLAQEVLDEIG